MKKTICFLFLYVFAIACQQKTRSINIDLWYGDEQHFGQLGNPQKWINVLGNISGEDSIARAFAVLNDKDTLQLTLGSDKHRLAKTGDFNVDFSRNLYQEGKNKLEIVAETLKDKASTVAVINVKKNNIWPLPYSIKWNEVSNIQEVAEVMDGKWEITANGIYSTEPYYDRVFTIGDSTWKDYEISTTVTFHDFTIPEKGPPTYNVSHAALATRFHGHDQDTLQPNRKWYPVGATAEFRLTAELDSCRWRIFDGEHLYVEQPKENYRSIVLNQKYGMKHRIITLPNSDTKYQVKLWPFSENEPETWDFEGIEESPKNLKNGAALLIAHNTTVTFGDVEVIPL